MATSIEMTDFIVSMTVTSIGMMDFRVQQFQPNHLYRRLQLSMVVGLGSLVGVGLGPLVELELELPIRILRIF
jgi:hypothetical protein